MGRPKGSKNKPKVQGVTAPLKPKAKTTKAKGWPPADTSNTPKVQPKVQSANPKCKNGTLGDSPDSDKLQKLPESVAEMQPSAETPKTRGRKPTPKDVLTCEHCGSTIPGTPYSIKINQLLGTGEYYFRAANMKPQLCHKCWQELVTLIDDWLLAHGNPEKFKNGAGKDGKVG